MAAAKKEKKELKPTKKDLRIFLYMSKLGGISYESLTERFGYSEDTIRKRFSKLNCIQRNEEDVIENGKSITKYVYSLNKKGKEVMLQHDLNHHCGKYFGYEHLLKCEQELFRLVGRDELFDAKKDLKEMPIGIVALEDIQGEAEQRFKHEANINILKKQGMSISVVDFLYVDSKGESVAVEVETSNYRKERREAHYNYVKHVLHISDGNYKVVK